jgi:hypothetical protein
MQAGGMGVVLHAGSVEPEYPEPAFAFFVSLFFPFAPFFACGCGRHVALPCRALPFLAGPSYGRRWAKVTMTTRTTTKQSPFRRASMVRCRNARDE